MAATDLLVLGRLGRDARLRLFGFRGIEQCRNNGCRADAHRDTGLDQLGAPFFAPFATLAHCILCQLLRHPSYAVAALKGRAVR